ncbi:MAG: tRNA nucleotidyltransferase/poly(A) polymerase [Candidatus Deianiraeaceae bacterium]|jgi:tRNA nucleotidyltransferase/poly(A) polymerase
MQQLYKILDMCGGSYTPHYPLNTPLHYKSLFVGGLVRDYIKYLSSIGVTQITRISSFIYHIPMYDFSQFIEQVKDIDISTTLMPKQVAKLLDTNFPNLIRKRMFVTNAIGIHNANVEITSTRMDMECDGRHAKMKCGVSFFHDSLRRDFSFNALYLSTNGILFDFHSGVEHLLNNKIYFIGDPEQKIKEDYTRIKRYWDFSKRLGVNNEEIENTIDYIMKNSADPIIMR